MKLRQACCALLMLPLLLSTSGCVSLLRQAERAADVPARSQARLPEPVRVQLANGMTLLVVYRPNLPIVSLNVVLRAGAVTDPAGKAGLASLTAALLKRGTQTRKAPQIAEAIDSVGGTLTSAAGPDSASVGVSVLTKDIALGVDLLSDVLQHPAFDNAELGRLREEQQGALKAALDDANAVVKMAFHQAALKGNPYGQPTTLSSLGGITTADVRAFYNTYYRPNNAVVAVVGDLTPEQARERFSAAFKQWQRLSVPAAAVAPLDAATGRKVLLVDMDVNQSFVMFGHPAVKRNNPDYFAMTVLNFILGGDFTSRLNQSIRDRQGLAYGAGSSFQFYREAGLFAASLNTRTATTGQAVTSLVKEIAEIQTAKVTDAELKTAKAYLTGSFPLRFETNQQLAGEIVNTELYGLPVDYMATYRDRISAVTADDVQRVARKYLQPGNYRLVVVGKAAELGHTLEPFGDVQALPKESLIK